jgi:glutamate N-acetyltransferase / amino-acid N-acetyltransferase
MAVGEAKLPVMYPVTGFRLGTVSAGIKTPGRSDLVVMDICEGATVAGVFTRNAFCAAPVQIAKRHLAATAPRYFVVNTGNANAGTGEQGLLDSISSCSSLAALVSTTATVTVTGEEVLPFSTGVIGEPLPVEKIIAALPEALDALIEAGWVDAASGIMTTDTRPKGASLQFGYQNQKVTVTGIAKGAGMIKPNMATMLGYIATDVAVAKPLLDNMLKTAVEQSFNRITIDGDTSTNDACMLVATAQSPLAEVDNHQHPLYQPLQDAISTICIELAQGLVRDGEGATKFVSVVIDGGASEQESLQVAYTIAESPLVKTALFASDPNWGRLLAAIGRAGINDLDVAGVSLRLNGILIAENGCRAASYTEQQGVDAMAAEDIIIAVDLNRGQHSATVWTTDLSTDYVRINAEYRT